MTIANIPKILLKDAAVTRTGNPMGMPVNHQGYTVQAIIEGSGAVSATVEIYGSHRNTNSTSLGELLGTLSPTGTDAGQDSFAFDAPWPFIFAVLTAISGTGAKVNVSLGG